MPSRHPRRLRSVLAIGAVGAGIAILAGAVLASEPAPSRDAAATPTISASPLGVPAPPTPSSEPPPAASPSPSQPALLPPIPPGGTVVTIGDSIMRGYGLPSDQAWPALLSAGAPWHLVNLACDGAGFVTMGDGCDTNFMGLIPQAVEAKPTVVVIQSSSNDMGQSDAAIEAASQETMAALRAALPHVTIVALSTVWNADTTWPHEIASSSASIERAAAHQQAHYVDLGQPLAGHPEWMQPDDVHPTAEGQHAIADAVHREIAPLVTP